VLRARYYDPSTGEFTSPDPLEYVDGMSLYRGYFVGNFVDPSGKDWLDEIVKCRFYKWVYAGNADMDDDEYMKCLSACQDYVDCYKDCVLVITGCGAVTGGVTDGIMELPIRPKSINQGTEDVTSLGNSIWKKCKNSKNPIVNRFAEWAKTSGTGSSIPGIRSDNCWKRRIAKVTRNCGRVGRGAAVGAAVTGLFAAAYCSQVECAGK
jgi:hypothetical protein